MDTHPKNMKNMLPPAYEFCFLPVGFMAISSKRKIVRLSTPTPSLLIARLLSVALFVLASMLRLPAQNVVSTGAIRGRVTDQRGAVVPESSVVVRNLATGLQHSAVTDRTGLYQFLALMPGTYSVTATGKGFHDIAALVRVLVGNTTLQDLRLQVGASAETVKVSATMPLLRPTESSASSVLDRSFVDELPLNGRRYTDS